METTDELFEPSKRPKLNPMSEQEENIASEEITNTEEMGQRSKEVAASEERHQPSTSNTQMMDRQQSMEIPSYVKSTEKEKDIKDRFKEIKMSNERLNAETYVQYRNLTLPN